MRLLHNTPAGVALCYEYERNGFMYGVMRALVDTAVAGSLQFMVDTDY